MKKMFLLSFTILCCVAGSAQMVLHDPVTGRTFDVERYSSTRGTPFLFEKWLPGTATSERGIYKNLELKLDAFTNTLYFNRNDELYEFIEQIKSFTIISGDTLYFKKGLSGNNLKPDQYVQVLAEGKVNFYKSEIKSITEMSEINAGMVKTFISSTRYFISKDDKLEMVKLNKDILDFMGDKKDQIKDFMDSNKISAKKESDFVKIIRLYNSLL